MTHDPVSSIEPAGLLVRDVSGTYRPAAIDEVLHAAQALLWAQVRGQEVMSSPQIVRDFLRVRLGALEHEVFAVLMLDAHHALLDYVELFRGTVTQSTVYPREVVKECLLRNAAAVILVHNHPSGCPDPCRADRSLTEKLTGAVGLIDVQVLDHLIVAGHNILSFAENGLI